MVRFNKAKALARLVEIAETRQLADDLYDEQVGLWEQLIEAGVSQAELARIAHLKHRGDVMQAIRRRHAQG